MTNPSVLIAPADPPLQDLSAAAPIVITYYLSSELSVQTTVIGEARNIATVAIMAGSIIGWSGTMTQITPKLLTTFPITVGNVTIEQGAEFHLTVPTAGPAGQPGQMYLKCMIDAQGTKQEFSAQIASWSLT